MHKTNCVQWSWVSRSHWFPTWIWSSAKNWLVFLFMLQSSCELTSDESQCGRSKKTQAVQMKLCLNFSPNLARKQKRPMSKRHGALSPLFHAFGSIITLSELETESLQVRLLSFRFSVFLESVTCTYKVFRVTWVIQQWVCYRITRTP